MKADSWGLIGLAFIAAGSFAVALLQWTWLAFVPILTCWTLGLVCVYQAAKIEKGE